MKFSPLHIACNFGHDKVSCFIHLCSLIFLQHYCYINDKCNATVKHRKDMSFIELVFFS